MQSFSNILGLDMGLCASVNSSSCFPEGTCHFSSGPSVSGQQMWPLPSKFPASRLMAKQANGVGDIETDPESCTAKNICNEACTDKVTCSFEDEYGVSCILDFPVRQVHILFRREYNWAVGLKNDQERRRQQARRRDKTDVPETAE